MPINKTVRSESRNPALFGQKPCLLGCNSTIALSKRKFTAISFFSRGWRVLLLFLSFLHFLTQAKRPHIRPNLFYVSRHSAFGPVFPASFQPRAFSRSAGQIEYCSSWFNHFVNYIFSCPSPSLCCYPPVDHANLSK